jgi:hypothetical protein
MSTAMMAVSAGAMLKSTLDILFSFDCSTFSVSCCRSVR